MVLRYTGLERVNLPIGRPNNCDLSTHGPLVGSDTEL